jgi:integrase
LFESDLDQGENPVYVSKQLGHASPVVTLTIYAHVINSVNPKAASRLEEKIFKKNGSKPGKHLKKRG